MGREIVNRQVNIFIQSGDAQKAYDALIKKEKTLNEEIAKTTDPKRLTKLKNDLAALQEPIDRAAKKLSGELNPAIADTAATAARLRAQLRRMSDGDADFKKVTAQYAQATRELETQRQKVGLISKAWKSFWQEAKTVAAGVIIGNTIQSALQTVLGYVTGIVTGSAKIADELSDIEKTTGLTSKQVKDLNKELGKIDTRTSRSELRKLASEAGKLGFESSGDILKFVDAADKIKVALGEDLGENAIIEIAKASKIFGVEMLNIASAINEIGASSAATESFAVDFIKRTGGVASTVKIAAGDILGYASAIEQAGLTAEVSTTALNTFFLDFVSSAEKFGKAAGFANGELSKLITEKGTNEGFLQWLQKLKDANPTAAAFINKLKDLGIDGARGSNVMLTLSKNIGEVRKQQEIANTAIASNSSILTEFNKKNNNAAAELAKFKKNLAGMFEADSLRNAGASVIRILNGFVNLVKASIAFVREHGVVVGVVSAFYALFVIRIKGATIAKIAWNTVLKIGTIFTNLHRASLIAWDVVILLVTRRIGLASAAQVIWTAATKAGAGAIGAMLVVVGAIGVGLVSLFTKTKKLTAEQKLNNEIEKKAAETYAEKVARIKQLIAVASNELVSLKNRTKALDEAKTASGGYLNALNLENIATAEGTRLIDSYIESLKKSARAKAVAELSKDKEKRKIEIETELDVLNSKFDIKNETGMGAFLKNLFAGKNGGTVGNQIRDLRKELKGVDTDLTALYARIEKNPSLQEAIVTGVDGSNLTDGGGSTDKKTKNVKDKIADLLKDLQKLQQDMRLSQLSALDRELAELDIKFASLRERAGKNVKLLLLIDSLYHEARINIIREFARKEVAEWSNAQDGLNKKADEMMKKNLEALKIIQKRIFDDVDKVLERQDANRLAGRELEVIKSRGKAKLQAELALLKEQERQELSAKDLTENQKLLIEEKYRQKRKQAEIDHIIEVLQTVEYFLQGIVNIDKIFSDARTARENRELEGDRILNESKKRNLENRLKAGLITQLQYNREVERMEREMGAKERKARREQFERDRRAQIAAAVINNLGAVSTTLQKFGPPLPPNFLGIAAMGLTILTGLAQVTAIASAKPPQFARGGKLEGRYHSQGGNAIIDGSGRKIGEIEKEEGILNKFSMRDTRKYTATGTISQIASTFNSMHGGRKWDSSAQLRPAFSYKKPVPMNFSKIQQHYAAGGKYSTAQTTSSGQSETVNLEMIQILGSSIDTLNALLARGIKAYTVLSETEDAQKRMDAIRNDATMQP